MDVAVGPGMVDALAVVERFQLEEENSVCAIIVGPPNDKYNQDVMDGLAPFATKLGYSFTALSVATDSDVADTSRVILLFVRHPYDEKRFKCADFADLVNQLRKWLFGE